jgi:hypothetical protein
MLSNALVTNEIKDSAGVEVEFDHLSLDGREHIFRLKTEGFEHKYRLRVDHEEIGKGADQRRRSLVQFSKEVAGVSGTERKIIFQVTGDIPEGDLSDAQKTVVKDVLANLLSFCATTGAATTVLFDCTGNGAVCLVDGSS